MKILGFISRSITAKLILLFLATSLVPLSIIGILNVVNIRQEVQNLEYQNLSAVGKLKTNQITTYLNDRFTELDVLAKSGDALSSYKLLADYHSIQGNADDEEFDIQSDAYADIYKQVDAFFRFFTESFNFYDLFLICSDHGHVMYSVKRESDLGKNLSGVKLRTSGLGRLWKQVKQSGQPLIVDYSYYAPSGEPAAFLGAPILNDAGDLVAIIALQINHSKVNEIMLEDAGMGQTGNTYLVGEDFLMRSASRHQEGHAILEKEIRTPSVELALANQSGVHVIEGPEGHQVLSFYSPIYLKESYYAGFDWVIISEIDTEEAFSPVQRLVHKLILLTLISILGVLVIAYLLANSFTTPIKNITRAAHSMAKGNLDVPVNVRIGDEIGQMATAFSTMQANLLKKVDHATSIAGGDLRIDVTPVSDKDEMGKAFALMTQNLKQQIGEIVRFSQLLSASNNQLLATVSQLTTSTQESSTTISEISSTLDEVRKTAEISAEKAKGVSEMANKSVQISERGLSATQNSFDGMTLISTQVKKISDTIIKLSDQSQAIGEITSTVKAIAEQSNLLAVNASIEAVNAGEYGKGFTIVAQEIRALADQSKQSTRQINEILQDVQKSISDAVMATEEGGKAVNNGIELSEEAGDSIGSLAENISEAAKSSVQIAASSKQQLAGFSELNSAMDNIRVTVEQNSKVTGLTREAIAEMQNIVRNLDDLVNKYQIEDNENQ